MIAGALTMRLRKSAIVLSAAAVSACSAGPPTNAGSAGGTSGAGVLGTGAVGAGAVGAGAVGTGAVGAGGDPGFIIAGQGGGVPIAAPSCASVAYKSSLLPSSLLFLVDRSGSMNCNLPPTTDSAECEKIAKAADPSQPTKWSVIKGALSSAFDQLGGIPNTSAALTLFSNDDVCGAQSAPNVGLKLLDGAQVGALKSALDSVDPAGATPIIGSTILGFHYLHEVAQVRGNRYVVLVTDGADSCADQYAAAGVTGNVVDRLLDVELPRALSVNIRTFVIGAPGSEPARGLLSKIAFAGGTAKDPSCDHGDDPAPGAECHFDMTRTSDFAKDLSAALQRVTGKAAMTCEFEVPKGKDGQAVDPSKVNVDYYKGGNVADPSSHVELYRDDTKPCDAGASGWQYIDGNQKISLCGQICDQVRADASAQVVVSVGCAQRQIM
jgi:hypothetical protein